MKWLCCAALVLSVTACSAEELPWYQTALIYQIYPLSFKDSDGDGVGDLKGIIESCGYLKDVGVDAVWLTPFYKSPMSDFGYDITNHTEVDRLFGTMADFDDLRGNLNNLGIKLLIDFDPNHTSNLHPWFLSSRDPSHPDHDVYRDFYIWRNPRSWDNGTTPVPPNNWMSVFGGSAWQWGEERRQFYLHQCRHHQPDLNYRNPAVLRNMTDVLKFWMNKGVDGFRVGAMKHVFEDETFPDEPPVPGTRGNTYNTLQHIYSQNQPETFQLMEYWTNLTSSKNVQDRRQRALFFEVYEDIDGVMRFYRSKGSMLAAPLNPFFLSLSQNSRSTSYKALVDSWITHMPATAAANWVILLNYYSVTLSSGSGISPEDVLSWCHRVVPTTQIGNHDYPRTRGRLGSETVDTLNLLTGVLPGVKMVYYGEEIGMEDIYVREDQVKYRSIFDRDRQRSPMQWDDSLSAGFSTNSSTWLPVNPNYWWLNVAAQRSAQFSHLKVFQEMAQARKDPVLQRGDLQVMTPDNDTLLIVRKLNATMYILLINFGSEVRTYTSLNLFKQHKLDMNVSIVTGSISYEHDLSFDLQEGSISLTVRPKAAVLLTSPPASLSTSVCRPFSLAALLVIISLVL